MRQNQRILNNCFQVLMLLPSFFIPEVKFIFYIFHFKVERKEFRAWRRAGLFIAFHSHEQRRFDKMWLLTYQVGKGVVNWSIGLAFNYGFAFPFFFFFFEAYPNDSKKKSHNYHLFSEYKLLLEWYNDVGFTINSDPEDIYFYWLFKIVAVFHIRLYFFFFFCHSEIFIEYPPIKQFKFSTFLYSF